MICWNEPLWVGDTIAGNSVVRATREDIIRWQKLSFPERDYTDEDALLDFIMVNWAWEEPE